MTGNGEEFPIFSSAHNLGSNRAYMDMLKVANSDKLPVVVQSINFQSFWSADERDFAYERIDTIEDKDEREETTLYVSNEWLKWVKRKSFNEYPYAGDQHPDVAGFEIQERISKAFEVLAGATEKPSQNIKTLSLSISLADGLQFALDAYEEWSKHHLELKFDHSVEGMRARAAVAALTCLDVIKKVFPYKASEILGDRSLVTAYIEQFEHLKGPEKNSPLFEIHGENVIEELVDIVDLKDERAIKNLVWLFDNLKVTKSEERTEQDVIRTKILNRAMRVIEYYKEGVRAEMDIRGLKATILDLFVPRDEESIKYKAGLEQLNTNLADNFEYIILKQPDHLKALIAEYDRDKHADIWRDLSKDVYEVCVNIGRSDLDSISKLQTAFCDVCPRQDVAKQLKLHLQEWYSGIYPVREDL